MSTNNYGYGDSYPYNSRQQTSQSGQQSFSTPNPTASGSYFGLQAGVSATATRGFTNSDYQSQQYPQQRSTNDTNNVNWYYPNKAVIAASNDVLPNANLSEQQSSTASKAPSQQSYDTTGLGNLAYASALNYGSSTDTSQAPTTADYSTATTCGERSQNNGQTQTHQRTSSQIYDHNRQATTNARSFQSNTTISTQRRTPLEIPRSPTSSSYNLPNPSPTYPQSLINTYPSSATSAAIPRALALSTSRNSDVSEENQSQMNVQQTSYTNQYSYPQAQPQAQSSSQPPARTQPQSQVQRSGRISPEQRRKTQTPTPPAPPLLRVPPVNPKAMYQGHLTQSQPASSPKSHAQQNQTIQNPASHTRAEPAPSMSPSSMLVNRNRTTNASTTPQQSQSTGVQYSSRWPIISEPQRVPTPIYLPQALQRSAGYQHQQQPAAQPREPSPDRPMTVDPSHVYNRYHEYQKQIEAAEAEKARLAALEAAQDAANAAEAAEAAATLRQTSMANNDVKESESDEDEEVNQQIASEAGQRAVSHETTAVTKPSRTNVGAAETSDLAPNAKDPSAAAMEEEMRMMVEKLREYQTKDPKLFLRVWSSVKKTTQSPQVDANHGQSDATGSGLGGALATLSPTIPLNQGIPTAGHGGAAASTTYYESQDSASVSPPPNPNPKKRGSRAKAAVAERRVAKMAKRAAKEQAKEEEKMAKAVALAEVGQTQPKVPYGSTPQQTSRSPALPQPPASRGNVEVVYHANSPTSANRPAPNSVGKSPPPPILPLSATGNMTTPATVKSKNLIANPNSTTKTSNNKGGLWPDDQRDLIANTSANVLNGLTENKGKIIRAQQIRQMLEANPSYVELCEKIEKLGLTMDRARFAKTLLEVIQGTLKNPQPGLSGGAEAPSSTGGTNLVQQPTGNSHAPAVVTSASSSRLVETRILPPEDSSRSALATTSPAAGSGIKRGRGRPRKDAQRKAEDQRSGIAPQTSAIHPESQGAVGSVHAEVTYPSDEAERPATSTVPYNPPIWSRDGPMTSSACPGPPIQYNSDYASPYAPGSSMPAGPSHTPQMVSTPSTVNPKQKRGPFAMKNQPLVNGQFAGIQQIYQSIYQQDGGQHAQEGRADTAIGGQPGAFHNEVGAARMESKPGTSLLFAYHSTTTLPNTRSETPPKPVTKEMAARKRTFAEILDLTKDLAESDEDEDDEPEAKMRRVGDRNNDYPDTSLRVSAPLQQANAIASIEPQPLVTALHPFTDIKIDASTPISLEVTPNSLPDFDGIILPIDRSTALRKSRYNPKTIARDVLITTSRHPSQRGLNAHLEGLKKRFTKVDDTSDLSTFHWDIVDPGGLPVGSANMDTEPEKTGDNDRSSFQTEQQHSASPLRGPILPGSNYTLSSRGPGCPPMHDPTPSKPSSLRNESNLNSGFSVIIDLTQPAQPKRIGRPPKDPNAPPKVKVPGRGPGRPPKDPNAPPKVHTPGRPPGRPRKIVDPDEFQLSGSKAGSPNLDEYDNIIKRRPGRPAKNRSSAPSTSSKRICLDSPKFVPFLCEWKKCKAELQNLETLRNHIYTVHGKNMGPKGISCHWAKCGPSDIEPKLYPTAQAFKDHVEADHLVPYSWHMGDGPRGSTLDGSTPPSTPPYLFSNGTQITPSIRNQKIEFGNPIANNARRLAEAAAARPQNVWEYMFGKDVVLNPALRVGTYPFDGKIEYEDPLLGLREYDDELRKAAWEAERTGEEPRAVFGRV